jgi:hypothetical protein
MLELLVIVFNYKKLALGFPEKEKQKRKKKFE